MGSLGVLNNPGLDSAVLKNRSFVLGVQELISFIKFLINFTASGFQPWVTPANLCNNINHI